MSELVYSIELPPSKSSDVLVREFHIVVNGKERVVKLSPNIKEYKVTAKHGDQVSVFIVDIDEANNVSEPSETLDWLVVDKIAPKRPDRPILSSVEESLEEEVIQEHTHCHGDISCEEVHEHCSEHHHCNAVPCEETHEHCGSECVDEPCH